MTDKIWTAITAFAAAVAALAALLTGYFTSSSWQEQQKTTRPYFSITDQSIRVYPDAYKFYFALKNVGIHPASDTEVKFCWSSEHITGDPACEVFDMTKEVIGQSVSQAEAIRIRVPRSKDDIDFVVLALNYQDPIREKPFQQTYFMRLVPKADGKSFFLLYLSKQEKDKILALFQGVLFE